MPALNSTSETELLAYRTGRTDKAGELLEALTRERYQYHFQKEGS